jgi:hypothetical protein
VVTIIELRSVLEPLGWRFDGTHLSSPSGGYWLSEAMLASPIEVYLPIARRREMARRMGLAGAEEYESLLGALEAEPEVSHLASRVRATAEIAAPWAAEHGATVSLWDFSLPLVRATARHPITGVACVECEVRDAAEVSVVALHWSDDRERGVRRLWKQSVPGPTPTAGAGALRKRLDEAVRLLLEPRELGLYQEAHLASGPELAASARGWEDGLAILH